MSHPTLGVAVIMQKTLLASRWQSEMWEAVEVIPDVELPGSPPRRIKRYKRSERWLYPGFAIDLYRDEAEGYYLNISTTDPVVFVMWREEDGQPEPKVVTLSYNEAARMLDAQEHVDSVPMPMELCAWLRGYVEQNYKPEQKKRMRPPSFRGAQRDDRERNE